MNTNPNDSHIARATKYADIEAGEVAAVPELAPEESYDIHVKVDSPEQTDAFTIILSATNPYQLLLPKDPSRKRAVVTAVDTTPVVICTSLELAQNPQNAATGAGLPASGFVLPHGLMVTIESRGALWVANTTATACRVSVIVDRYEV